MTTEPPPIRHLTVFSQEGKFAGWPANSGMWAWGDELLAGFAVADYQEKAGHTYRPESARQVFARSRDGGETWEIEDAFEHGIVARAKDHAVPDGQAVSPGPCPGGFDVAAPDFAMTFRREDDAAGASHFYGTTDRGQRWQGPYALPNFGFPGLLARTDYVVEGPQTLLAVVTASKQNRREGRPICIRTRDGGATWNLVAAIGPEPEGYAIMPATVRLVSGEYLTVLRCRESGRCRLAAYASADGGASWRALPDPVPDTGGGNPPALVRLADDRLCLAYAVRGAPSRLCARVGSPDGRRWSEEITLREDDANWDVGYPRMVQRPDGTLVLLYYYNHAMRETPSWRSIEATLWRA